MTHTTVCRKFCLLPTEDQKTIENIRAAKISVENLGGMKNFPKNTPSGYPDLKKTNPLETKSVLTNDVSSLL